MSSEDRFHPFTVAGNLRILALSSILGFGIVCAGRSLTYGWGTIDTVVKQEFSKNGKKIELMQEEIRCGPDRYFLQTEDGSKVYKGTFKMDDGSVVTVTDVPLPYLSEPKISKPEIK